MALNNTQLATLLATPDDDGRGHATVTDVNAILSELIDRIIAMKTTVDALVQYNVDHP